MDRQNKGQASSDRFVVVCCVSLSVGGAREPVRWGSGETLTLVRAHTNFRANLQNEAVKKGDGEHPGREKEIKEREERIKRWRQREKGRDEA